MNYKKKAQLDQYLKILRNDKSVIALGGGAFINLSIRKEVKSSCVSFWLDLDPKFLIRRLKNVKKRPLLDPKNLGQSINKIYSERKKIYSESDFRIKCDFLRSEKIVEKILKIYEKSKS